MRRISASRNLRLVCSIKLGRIKRLNDLLVNQYSLVNHFCVEYRPLVAKCWAESKLMYQQDDLKLSPVQTQCPWNWNSTLIFMVILSLISIKEPVICQTSRRGWVEDTFVALLLSLHRVPVFFQLFFCEIAKRVGGKGASVLLVLSDESLIGRRKQRWCVSSMKSGHRERESRWLTQLQDYLSNKLGTARCCCQ